MLKPKGDNIENLMQEFAKIKCKELLEIVVEKAKAEIKYEYSGNTGSEYLDEWAVVDKDSILNAVDLEKFCSWWFLPFLKPDQLLQRCRKVKFRQ